MARPYRAWGYPWTTGIAMVASVLFLVGSILTDQKNAPWALAILLLSYPVFPRFEMGQSARRCKRGKKLLAHFFRDRLALHETAASNLSRLPWNPFPTC